MVPRLAIQVHHHERTCVNPWGLIKALPAATWHAADTFPLLTACRGSDGVKTDLVPQILDRLAHRVLYLLELAP